jgi:membrane protein
LRRRQPLKPNAYWRAFRDALKLIGEVNVSLIAAGVAFYGMLSLFPALAALIAILSLISNPDVVLAQLAEMRDLLPEDVFKIINGQVTSLVTASTGTLGWTGFVSLMVALWTTRSGVGAMMLGLNIVYSEQNRKTARHFLRSLLLTICLVIVGIVALLTVVVAPIVISFFPLGWLTVLLIDVVRLVIAIGVLLAGLSVLYRFGPNRRSAQLPWITPGAVLAVVSWVGVSIGFSQYVSNFGSYNQIYGSIGAVIAMLVWLWFSSFLVLLGAALNAQIEQRHMSDGPVDRSSPYLPH